LGTGVGRGATGFLLLLTLPGRKFEFPVLARFTFARGTLALPVVLAFAGRAFAFPLAGRFALARFAFAFVLPFSFVFLGFGRLGLLSFPLDEFVLRFSFVFSSGVTVSGDSPSFAGRLISIATVCPVFTTSPARGN
jgi:hypothetical protein